MIEMHKKLTKQFGSIVRMQGLTAEDMIFLYDPTYIETVSFEFFYNFSLIKTCLTMQ